VKLAILLAVLLLAAVPVAAQEKIIRVGILGTDTSHVPAFTAAMNGGKATGDLVGYRVVAAFPGGSSDMKALSVDRVQKFAAQIKDKYDVELVSSIDELLQKVDVVLLESVDGRPHWKQAMPVLKARKPIFIDKPIAASLADALRIFELAKETKTPVFTSSSLRFGKKIDEAKADPKLGGVLGVVTYGPCSYAEHHPELSFYGIHGLENIYAFMGKGCKTITRTSTPDVDVVTGVWNDGRVATYRGIRNAKSDFTTTIFGKTAILTISPSEGYAPMLQEIGKFFRTGVSPVPMEETLEIMAIIDAGEESKKRGGAPVQLEEIFQKARAEIAAGK
jgi:hypothetical protein